jgi:hypothetical protein
MGITIDQVRQYAAGQDKFALSRYQITGRGTEVDRVVGESRKAGGVRAYLQDQTSGLHGKAKNEKLKQLTELLGEAEGLSLGMDTNEAVGGLRLRSADLYDSVKGKGLYDPTSKKDLSRQKLREEGKAAGDDAKKLAGQDLETLQKNIPNLTGLSNGIHDVGIQFLNGAGRMGDALNKLADHIGEIVGEEIPRADSEVRKPKRVEPKAAESYGTTRSNIKRDHGPY